MLHTHDVVEHAAIPLAVAGASREATDTLLGDTGVDKNGRLGPACTCMAVFGPPLTWFIGTRRGKGLGLSLYSRRDGT